MGNPEAASNRRGADRGRAQQKGTKESTAHLQRLSKDGMKFKESPPFVRVRQQQSRVLVEDETEISWEELEILLPVGG